MILVNSRISFLSCVYVVFFGNASVFGWHLPVGLTAPRSPSRSTPRTSRAGGLHSILYSTPNDENENDDDDDDNEDEYDNRFPGSRGAPEPKLTATLRPSSSRGIGTVVTESDAPDRWLVPLNNTSNDFVMVDVPPYSPRLFGEISDFVKDGRVVAVLVTNRNSLHYDDAPRTVYRSSRSELGAWWRVMPDAAFVAHRVDVPRDSRPHVTQILDGYGPWAWNGTAFEETGRPLTVLEWNDENVKNLWDESVAKKDDDVVAADAEREKRAVREKERGRDLLAVYTPGHTMGSVCYVFPNCRACASGFTIPEDTSSPRLDAKGYVSTNRGTVERQVDSARRLVEDYSDRFNAVLPSRGGMIELPESEDGSVKRQQLERIIAQFEKVGKIYDSLGITPNK